MPVIMLTATQCGILYGGPLRVPNTLFIPMCSASQPALVFLQVNQVAGNSPTYFHLGSLNTFRMSNNAGEQSRAPSVLSRPLSHQAMLADLIILSSAPQSAK